MIRSRFTGCGSYLPENVLSNDELAESVDTSDEWIRSRTGISERRIAAEGELTSDLAVRAGQKAMDAAGLTPDDIDLVIVATATPDETFPATATIVQAKLGIHRGCAFDVGAVCSGFVYALAVADNFIRTGQVASALVIGAETFSRIIDWSDRSTCILFGDGAGAVVLQASEGDGTIDDRGILKTSLRSDGRTHDLLYVDGGPSSTQSTGHLKMSGKEVFRHAVVNLTSIVRDVLCDPDLTGVEIDWLIPHQANRRILDSTAQKLGIPPSQVIVTIDKHANTSAASVPLALSQGISDGRVKTGDVILMEAMGGGFTWGACLARW